MMPLNIDNQEEPPDSRPKQKVVAFLLYDDECGPCTRFKNVVVRLDIKHKLIPIPLESNLAYELVRSEETREEMMQAFHIVYSTASQIVDGEQQDRIFRAGDALIQLIRLLPLGSIAYWVIARFSPLRKLIQWLYPYMAKLRAISVSCKAA
jgi:predicted DCC family thiol-disulfide oxidoreductase YuxK